MKRIRKHTALTVLALALSLVIGVQLVTTQVEANAIEADVGIHPEALLLKDEHYGKWITAYVRLPEGYEIANINVSTVVLEFPEGQIPVSRHNVEGDMLMVKFDRAMLVSLLWPMVAHMSPRVKHEVTLTVTGSLYGSDTFEGSDTVQVFYTHL